MLLRVLFVTKGGAENIGIDKIKFVGYAFQIEMKYRTFVKFSIVEVLFFTRQRRI
jgi:dolichol-phosphate mannosyltransferase